MSFSLTFTIRRQHWPQLVQLKVSGLRYSSIGEDIIYNFINELYSVVAMCGIVGIFGERDAFTQIQKALRIMDKRGKEGFGLADGAQIHFAKDAAELKLKGKALLGHTLHAVVDFVPQPLRAKGTLVANCEIYNWQELNQKYNFQAQNDAEMLLHFLDQFGVEKLGELDGV